jgi:hypothetical protein
MITLDNSELSVSILHPVDDRDRLGVRYCSGGYVYQVEDKHRGPLFSGPEYPSASPSVINGQGMPDVFQFTQFDDPNDCPPVKMIIGVGVLDNAVHQKASDVHFSLPIAEACAWEIDTTPASVVMRTRQALDGHALRLERSLHLSERTLVSTTILANTGSRALMFRWFAHPFFPRMATDESCILGFPYVLPECGGFFVDKVGAIGLRDSYDWKTGCFQLLEGIEDEQFCIRQRHPKCDTVHVDGNFPLHRVALWANEQTFSIEPFLQRTLQPGEDYAWTFSYRF